MCGERRWQNLKRAFGGASWDLDEQPHRPGKAVSGWAAPLGRRTWGRSRSSTRPRLACPCGCPHPSGSAGAPQSPVSVLATCSLTAQPEFVHMAQVPSTQATQAPLWGVGAGSSPQGLFPEQAQVRREGDRNGLRRPGSGRRATTPPASRAVLMWDFRVPDIVLMHDTQRLSPPRHPLKGGSHPHFMRGETEARGGEVTCPSSYIRSRRAGT